MFDRLKLGEGNTEKEVIDTDKATESGARYRRAFCRQVEEYFSGPAQRVEKKTTYYPDGGVKTEDPIILPSPMPTFQGFAAHIGVSGDVLRIWREEHPEFDRACRRAQMMQEDKWLVNSMAGLYNSSFAQFYGKTALGYSDKAASAESAPREIEIRVVE